MEAKIQSELPRGEDWRYEPKWDGFRAVMFRDHDVVQLYSRNQLNLTRYFPELLAPLRALRPKQVVLDGEIVIFGGVGLDFEALLQRIHPAASRVERLAQESPAAFVAFDVLADADQDWRPRPLQERRRRLQSLLRGVAPAVYLSPVTDQMETALRWLDTFDGAGLDGLVAKRAGDRYQDGRRAMIKVKQKRTADCVVGGFRWSQDGKTVGSLLLGVYRGKTLHYIGHTSSFSASDRRALLKTFAPLRGGTSFGGGRSPGGPSRWTQGRDTEWEPLKPELVCEVAFDRMLGDRFRHGVRFLRWRPDKAPRQCTFAQLKASAGAELAQLFSG
jgi:ATP-dependent DNA ligase